MGFSLSQLVNDLTSMGFKISRELYPKNPHGSLEQSIWSFGRKTGCLTANRIMNLSGLFIAVKESSPEDMFGKISEQVYDYINAVKKILYKIPM